MIPATFACVFVSALGARDSTWKSAFILATGVTVCGVILFNYLLQVSLPMWRWGAPWIYSALTDLWYGFSCARAA